MRGAGLLAATVVTELVVVSVAGALPLIAGQHVAAAVEAAWRDAARRHR